MNTCAKARTTALIVTCLLILTAAVRSACAQPLISQAPSQAPPDDAARVERLATLGQLWGAIKYFHPYLAYRSDIDWDKAAVDAIARVERAATAEDFAKAVDDMLKTLDDPATKMYRPSAAKKAPEARQ